MKASDNVTISNIKKTSAKSCVANWSEEFFVIIMVKKLLERFTKKELQKANQKEFRVENVIKRKGDKLYVKWKGCDNSFNCWINKNDRSI